MCWWRPPKWHWSSGKYLSVTSWLAHGACSVNLRPAYRLLGWATVVLTHTCYKLQTHIRERFGPTPMTSNLSSMKDTFFHKDTFLSLWMEDAKRPLSREKSYLPLSDHEMWSDLTQNLSSKYATPSSPVAGVKGGKSWTLKSYICSWALCQAACCLPGKSFPAFEVLDPPVVIRPLSEVCTNLEESGTRVRQWAGQWGKGTKVWHLGIVFLFLALEQGDRCVSDVPKELWELVIITQQ